MIPETTIQEIREADLIGIIGQYVKLKRSGNEFVGLCPFHNEKTPSFYVHASKGYHCFGCDAKGNNAIDFIMAYEGKEFADAVIHVAGMAGIMIDESIEPIIPKIKPIQRKEPEPVDYIPDELVSRNLAAYEQSNLYKFLSSLVGEGQAGELCKHYGIGASNYYGNGTTLFVQRDVNGKVRQVKVILYDATTGNRRKEKEFEPKIIGRELVGYDKNLVQCLFGLPLLKDLAGKPVAIVESEKTAAICSIYYPKFLWLATGGKNGCNITRPEVNRVLMGRELHLFPDVDGVDEWRKKADDLRNQDFDVFVNDVIAKYPELVGSKADIADLIISARRVPVGPAKPQWFVNMQGVLKQYKAGQITGYQFPDLQDDNWKQSGLLMDEYVKAVNHFEQLN